MLPTISRINNAILKSELVKKLADKLSVDEDSIKAELKKVKSDYSVERYVITPVEAKQDSRSAAIIILALALESEAYLAKISEALKPEEFKNSSIRDAMGAIFALHKENKRAIPAQLITLLGNSGDAANLISEAAATLEIIDDNEKALTDCIFRIKKDNTRDRLADLQNAIKIAHSQKDENKVKELVTEYNSLVKEHKA